MWAKISALWLQTHTTVSPWYAILCTLSYKDGSTCPMTALLSEILFTGVQLYARYSWQVMAPKHASQSFLIRNLCIPVLPHITWKLLIVCGRSAYWMTALLLKTFLMWIRVVWEIRLESYSPMHTSWSFSDTTLLCVHWEPEHTSLFGTQTVHGNRSHVVYGCITNQTTGLLPTIHRFIRTCLTTYSIHIGVFQILMDTLNTLGVKLSTPFVSHIQL